MIPRRSRHALRAVCELHTPRLRVRGFRTRPSVVVLLRTIDQNNHPPLARYQRAMSVRSL